MYDPRTVTPLTDPAAYECQSCGEKQSDDSRQNNCMCFPNYYGTKARSIPVQVYRTPNGKNNGLLACCAFEQGAAIGEFIGEITSGTFSRTEREREGLDYTAFTERKRKEALTNIKNPLQEWKTRMS